ncbi:CAP domain-containing protein [Calidifontibacillus erzurumensis]|nr:CAP domain-containing protein [Calidifontibacillus erzurumensis]
MQNPGHRRNILDSRMTHIGVGYAKGGTYGHYWTQMFAKK